MDSSDCHAHSRFHVVAMPFPGRGHINPMMNVCVLLASKGLVVTFVVTDEWLSLIGSVPNAPNIHLRSIPNVIPSELNRGAEYNNFLEAVRTKMEYPFDQLLDKLDSQVGCIISDTELFWAVRVGNRRNIPVVSLFTESPMVFTLFYHSDLGGSAIGVDLDLIRFIMESSEDNSPICWSANSANCSELEIGGMLEIVVGVECIDKELLPWRNNHTLLFFSSSALTTLAAVQKRKEKCSRQEQLLCVLNLQEERKGAFTETKNPLLSLFPLIHNLVKGFYTSISPFLSNFNP